MMKSKQSSFDAQLANSAVRLWHLLRPLTLTLSPSEGEKEALLPRVRESGGIGLVEKREAMFPLPRGGGEGQGEGAVTLFFHPNSTPPGGPR